MWTDILAVAKALYEQVEAAQKNKEQATLIMKRVQSLLGAIQDAGGDVINDRNKRALTDLKEVLNEANTLITKFSGKHYIIQFVKAKGYEDDLADINAKIADLTQTFSTVLQLQGVKERMAEVLDAKLDRAAMQSDLTSIKDMEQAELDMLVDMQDELVTLTAMMQTLIDRVPEDSGRPRVKEKITIAAKGSHVGGDATYRSGGNEFVNELRPGMSAKDLENFQAVMRMTKAFADAEKGASTEERSVVDREVVVAEDGSTVVGSASAVVDGDSFKNKMAKDAVQPALPPAAAIDAMAREQGARNPNAGPSASVAGGDPANFTAGPTNV